MAREQRDRTLIKVNEPMELRYWATILRCTEVEIAAAVRAVGTKTDDVRKHLEATPAVLLETRRPNGGAFRSLAPRLKPASKSRAAIPHEAQTIALLKDGSDWLAVRLNSRTSTGA